MAESVHAPPVKQPNLTRRFPLSDMPTGLMAALVTPLADHLLIRRGSFDEFAVLEPRVGADQGDQVGCVDRSTAVLGGFDEFEGHRHAGMIWCRWQGTSSTCGLRSET